MLRQALGMIYGAASIRHNLVVGYLAAIIRYIFVDIVKGQSGGYGAPSMLQWLYANPVVTCGSGATNIGAIWCN